MKTHVPVMMVNLDIIRLTYKDTCSCVRGRENIGVLGASGEPISFSRKNHDDIEGKELPKRYTNQDILFTKKKTC